MKDTSSLAARLCRVPVELQVNDDAVAACWLVQTGRCVALSDLKRELDGKGDILNQLLKFDVLRLEWSRVLVTDLGLQMLGPLVDSRPLIPMLYVSLDGAAGMALSELRKSLASLDPSGNIDEALNCLIELESPETGHASDVVLWAYRVAAACVALPEPIASLAVIAAIRTASNFGKSDAGIRATRMIREPGRVLRDAILPEVSTSRRCPSVPGKELHILPVLDTWSATHLQDFLAAYRIVYSIVACAEGREDVSADKPWAGGFSYSSFYDQLRSRAHSEDVRLASVCFNSPGWIEMELPGQHADAIAAAVKAIGSSQGIYENLYSEARGRGLLGENIDDSEVQDEDRKFVSQAGETMQKILEGAFAVGFLAPSLTSSVKRMKMLFGVWRQIAKLERYEAGGSVRL